MRRSTALTTAAILALALAPLGAARAQDAPDPEDLPEDSLSVTVTKPSGSVSGVEDVEVVITETYGEPDDSPLSQGIASYKVQLENADGVVGTFCQQTFKDAEGNPAPRQGTVTVQFRWDTARYPTSAATNCAGGDPQLPKDGSPLPNGEYEIVGTATMSPDVQGNTPPPESDSVTVGVDNLPATPSGVKLKYSESEDRITVSWKANPEAGYDVVSYRVQECTVDRSSKPCDKGAWKTVDDVSDTSLSVTRTKPGIYRYRIVALRLNAAGTGWLKSTGAATPQSDPTEIQVDEDPESTTDTTQPDGDGGDEPPSEPETRTVVKPTRRVQRAAPQVLQRVVEEDPGFQEELPYEDDDGQAISGLPIDGNNEDGDNPLSMLIPLAGGLTLLVVALQLWYLNHRAARSLEPIPIEAYDDQDA